MILSKNFKLEEFTRSQTAIRYDIDNEPNCHQIDNIIYLVKEILQPLREIYGSIHINSGFRSDKLNGMIGGARNSQHCDGMAADINLPDMKSAFHYIAKGFDFDQLIWEFGDDDQPAWIHISYNKNGNRKEILKAVRENGKTKYIRL